MNNIISIVLAFTTVTFAYLWFTKKPEVIEKTEVKIRTETKVDTVYVKEVIKGDLQIIHVKAKNDSVKTYTTSYNSAKLSLKVFSDVQGTLIDQRFESILTTPEIQRSAIVTVDRHTTRTIQRPWLGIGGSLNTQTLVPSLDASMRIQNSMLTVGIDTRKAIHVGLQFNIR